MKKTAQQSMAFVSACAIILLALTFTSCGGGQDRASKQKLEETKQQTIQNINKYKNDIQERIDYVDQQLENASGELRDNLTAAREELKAQKEVLEGELQTVKNATLETWNTVIKETSDKLAKARSKMNEVSKNVRAWLDDQE